jgi:hypothetical protein
MTAVATISFKAKEMMFKALNLSASHSFSCALVSAVEVVRVGVVTDAVSLSTSLLVHAGPLWASAYWEDVPLDSPVSATMATDGSSTNFQTLFL